jgi:GntR family transcriptional regulator/MocR family aminotransferase
VSRVPEELFRLDRRRRRSLQAQIRETVVAHVLAGRMPPGARLPSTRGLARHLGVSRVTVALAYEELVAQGYLEALPRSGHRVAAAPPVHAAASGPARGAAISWEDRLTRRYTPLLRPVRKPRDWRDFPFPFVYGQVDPTLFDLPAWRECAREALSRADFPFVAGDYGTADDPDLVAYIRSHSLPRRGIAAGPEEVLVTIGGQNALWLVVQLLLGPGRRAVLERPCHPDLYAAVAASGAQITLVDVDAFGLPPEALPAELDVLFLTPSHQCPTAVRLPLDRRERLLQLASTRDFIIVEDDYEFEISFLEPPSPALRSLDTEGRVLYCGSFSKSLFPGLRLGYLVASAELVAEARALRALVLRHPPGPLQRTAARFLALGHYDALIRRIRSAFAERHAVMAEAIAREGLEIAGRSAFGGSSFWIRGPDGLDADRLADLLRANGVLVEPGSPFFPDGIGSCRHFRMAYSSIPAERIPEGVRRTARRVRELAGRQ